MLDHLGVLGIGVFVRSQVAVMSGIGRNKRKKYFVVC